MKVLNLAARRRLRDGRRRDHARDSRRRDIPRPGSRGEHALQQWHGTSGRAGQFYARQFSDQLTPKMVEFIGRMEMAFIATSDAGGECDCSFRAGTAGFLRVLDERTIAYPEFRGNGVMASLGNILENPHIGIFMADFTRDLIGLHVNGHAEVVTPAYMQELDRCLPEQAAPPGRRPVQWVLVRVTEAYIHCSKHIPKLIPQSRVRHWGTDNPRYKGGDYFGIAAQHQPGLDAGPLPSRTEADPVPSGTAVSALAGAARHPGPPGPDSQSDPAGTRDGTPHTGGVRSAEEKGSLLRTKRLLLRHWEEPDLAAFFDLYSRDDVTRWLGPHPRRPLATQEEARDRLRRWRDHEQGLASPLGLWAMVPFLPGEPPGQPVGTLLLLPLSDAGGPTGLVEVGWHLHPSHQGRGLATEAARAILTMAGKAGIGQVLALTDLDNVASQRVAERLGMQDEGVTGRWFGLTTRQYRLVLGC